MKFIQDKKTGSCDIIFSEKEIEIINKHKKMHLTAETLRHFGNALMGIVASFNLFFDEELANRSTYDTDIVEGEEPNDKN